MTEDFPAKIDIHIDEDGYTITEYSAWRPLEPNKPADSDRRGTVD